MLRRMLELLGCSAGASRVDSTRSAARFHRNRKWIAALSVLGMADSAYLLLYQTGAVKRLWCPGFGAACERISGSPWAYQGGIPDGVFGVAGYGALLAAAVAGPRDRWRSRPALPLLMGAGAAAGLGLSALLTYVQKKEFNDYCTWCLISAALASATAPLALPEALAALRTVAGPART